MTPPLRIHPLASSAPSVRLADWMPAGRVDAVFALASGERVWTRSATAGAPGGAGERTVVSHALAGGPPRPLDRIRFAWDAERFAEVSMERPGDPRNLHPRPLSLPATLVLSEPACPLPGTGARVTLAFAGPVRLALGDAAAEARAARLLAEQDGERHVQWLIEGWGEAALGPAGGGFTRWLEGAARWDGATLLLGVPAPLDGGDLPPWDAPAARFPESEGLFG